MREQLVHFEVKGQKLRGHIVGRAFDAAWLAIRVTGADIPYLRSTGYVQSDIIVVPLSAVRP